MTNLDELAIKFANVEGQLQGMAGSMMRIEQALDKVISMDRSLAEQVVKLDNQAAKIRELEHDIKNCNQAHKLAGTALEVKHDALSNEFNKFASRTEGVLLALKIFSGVAGFLVCVCCTWVYNQIDDSRKINITQDQAINEISRDIKVTK